MTARCPYAGLTVAEVVELTGATPLRAAAPDLRITGIAPLDRAGPNDLVFFDKAKFAAERMLGRRGAFWRKHMAPGWA